MTHLITGYAGYEHIQSEDAGAFNAAFFGGGQYVMAFGNQFEGSIIDNNTVRILDGDGLMYGRHFRIKPNTYEDVSITTGTAGMNRTDLIVMTYEKNENDGTELVYLQVIKGTECEGTAVTPEYTNGNILEGATFNQMPLYKVSISGVVLEDIEPMFTVIKTYKKLYEESAKAFQKACETHLDSLGVLDTTEEIEANTQPNQLAGALALKNWIITVMNHIKEKATSSVFGHVKLADSTSVTTYDGLALPTREKNASISGTLANLIANRLPLTGGTMVGNINIIKSGDAQIYLKDADSGAMHGTLVAKQNEIGMYSNTHSKWIWYHTAGGVSQFNGNASTATTANEARRLWVIDGLAYNGGTAGWGYESDYCDKNGVRVGYINTQYMGDGTVNFVMGADKGSVLIHGNNSNIATANKAACDWNGNNIVNTYFPKTGGTITGHINLNPGRYTADSFGSIDFYKAGENALSIFGGNDTASKDLSGTIRANKGHLYLTAASGHGVKLNSPLIHSGYLNAQVGNSFQVRNQDDTAWKPISAASFSQQSSKRYKKNIEDMSEERAKEILKLRPVVYDYINELDGTDCLGLIAEEVDGVEKYPVMYNENGEPEGIDYSRFVPMLIKMVQMQEKKIAELEKRIS